MASLEKTIEIIFGARDTTGPAIQQLKSGLDSLEDATQPFADIQSIVLETEVAILALSAALGALAIWEAGQLTESMAEVGTLFNATGEEVDLLTGQVKNFAATSTSDIGTITNSLYDAISATGNWEDAIVFLGEAEKLAVAGSTNLGIATNLLTGILNAYGLEMSEAGNVSDALFVAVQNGKTTIEELGHSIGRVASSAAAGNVDIDVLASAMAALTGAVGNTNISTTYLASLLKALSKPTTELETAMGGLSLETDGLVPILNNLGDATGGSQAEMNKLFPSVEAATAALILSTDAAGTFTNTLEAMESKTGRVSAAYDAMADQFSNINQRLRNNVTLSLIALGEDLTQGYGDLIGGITSVFGGLTSAIDNGAFKPLTDLFNQRAGEWADILREVGANLPEVLADVDFSELQKAFDDLFDSISGVFDAFFGDLDLTQPEDLEAAIQKVVDAVTALTNVSSSIIQSWEPVLRKFGEWATELINSSSETENFAGRMVALGAQINLFSGILSGVTGAVGSLADVIILIAGAKYLGAFGGSMTAVASAAGTLLGTLAGPALIGALVALGAAGVAAGLNMLGFGDAVNSVKDSAASTEGSTKTLGDAVGWLAVRFGAVSPEVAKAHDEMEQLALELETTTGKHVALGQEVGKVAVEILDVKTVAERYGIALRDLEKYVDNAKVSGYSYATALEALKDANGDVAVATEDLSAKTRDLAFDFSGLGPELEKLVKKLRDVGDAQFAETLQEAESNLDSLGLAVQFATNKYGEHSAIVQELKRLYGEQQQELDQVHTGFTKAADGSTDLSTGMGLVVKSSKEVVQATDKVAGSLTEVQKETIETERLLEELASNEKIAAMEFSAEIRVAEIEAEAQKVVAAFESISDTIGSLTEQTTSLIGIWAEVGSFDQLQLQEWIERSFEMQEAALEKQAELIDAQIKNLNAKTEALSSGKGLINIDGTGLDSYLEGMLVEIFKKIQIETSQEGGEFLLGML